jgi:hypothetical protein
MRERGQSTAREIRPRRVGAGCRQARNCHCKPAGRAKARPWFSEAIQASTPGAKRFVASLWTETARRHLWCQRLARRGMDCRAGARNDGERAAVGLNNGGAVCRLTPSLRGALADEAASRSPDERSDIRDFVRGRPACRCAHAGYGLPPRHCEELLRRSSPSRRVRRCGMLRSPDAL